MAYRSTGPSVSHKRLVASLSERIDQVLRSLIAKDVDVALLVFPNHSNTGDSAIWLGQKAYLRKIGSRLVYASDLSNHSHRRLASKLSNGIILLSGGGNLGDLWPQYQRFRESVISRFPGNRIIQLPQSIHFKNKENLERAKHVFDKHPDLTLLVRDKSSLALARNSFRAPSILCPDMSFTLGTLPRPFPQSQEIIWLRREDIESQGPPDVESKRGVRTTDWGTNSPMLERIVTLLIKGRPAQMKAIHIPFVNGIYDHLARYRFSRGIRMLAKGRVVITDRLHGHILSLLLGIPHILLDTEFGKNSAFYETWTRGCELAHWGNSPKEAIETAQFLLSQ